VKAVQGDSPSILFVEDDEVNQKVVQAMLKRLGCVPDLITNGLEALGQPWRVSVMILF